MIERVRILIPIYNLTENAYSVKAEKDEQQGRLVLRISNPSPSNLLGPNQYAILAYTTSARPEIQFEVTLFKDDTLEKKDVGLCAVKTPDDLEYDSILTLIEGDLTFNIPYRLNPLALNPKCTKDDPLVVTINIGTLVRGWISALRGQEPQN